MLDPKIAKVLGVIDSLIKARARRRAEGMPCCDLSLRIWWNCKILALLEGRR